MYIRKSNIKNIFLILLFGLILFSGRTEIYASDNKTEVPVTIKHYFEDKSSKLNDSQKTSTYILQSMDETNPMPEGSSNGTYSFDIGGDEGEYEFSLTFEKTGIYKYQILQMSKEKNNYKWDDTQYTMEVYVKNAESGGLIAEVIAKDGDDKKCSEIKFNNSYQENKTEPSNKTNTTTNGSHTSRSVRTGDSTKLLDWAVCGMIAFASMALLLRKKYKKD